MKASAPAIRLAKLSRYFQWLLGSTWCKGIVKRQLNRRIKGPDESLRRTAHSFVWGKAWNEAGDQVQARMRGPEAYTLTAITALKITRKVLEGNWRSGFQTPAGLYGSDFILKVEGTHREDIPT